MIKISELQTKDVVTITDGENSARLTIWSWILGKVRSRAMTVPGSRFFGMFGGKEFVIPWRQIVKIGADVVLVRLDGRAPEEEVTPKPLLNHPVRQLSTYLTLVSSPLCGKIG